MSTTPRESTLSEADYLLGRCRMVLSDWVRRMGTEGPAEGKLIKEIDAYFSQHPMGLRLAQHVGSICPVGISELQLNAAERILAGKALYEDLRQLGLGQSGEPWVSEVAHYIIELKERKVLPVVSLGTY